MNFKKLEQKVKEIEKRLDEIAPKTWIFTDDEKTILANISFDYNYIARDENGHLFLYIEEPIRGEYTWKTSSIWNGYCDFKCFDHMFKPIKWEDEKACKFRKFL